MISKFYENIATDTGLVVYGATETIKALESGGLEQLIIFENLDYVRVTLRNKDTDTETWQICKPDLVDE